MSRFFSKRFDAVEPYVPGEQPQNRRYIKLNTNESPFPPSEKAQKYAEYEIGRLNLYSDPECKNLMRTASAIWGIPEEQLVFTNSSDEALNFAFMAFCDAETPVVFPDITYGFYEVFSKLYNIPYRELPLKEDFSIDPVDYYNAGATVVIANPNAQTGVYLPLEQIENIVLHNPNNVVVIDEAYIDFGGQSAVSLVEKYSNLLVVQTFSKSRSMAGARLGFAIGSKELIDDIKTLKNSTNPYSVNRMSMAAGIGALEDNQYFVNNCNEIQRVRRFSETQFKVLGFEVVPSLANFLLVKHPNFDGKQLYLALKENGVLVRHLSMPRLEEYNRVTIGSQEQMEHFFTILKEVMGRL